MGEGETEDPKHSAGVGSGNDRFPTRYRGNLEISLLRNAGKANL